MRSLMTSILSVACLSTLSFANASPIHGTIVGGVEATRGEFPFMVSLQRSTSSRPFCGGSLIAPNWVLTAAHCVSSSTAQTTRVRIGHHNIRDQQDTESHVIKAVHKHSQFNNSTLDHDYALLELATASKFEPVRLQDAEIDIPSDPAAAPTAIVMGFGATLEGGPQSDVLLKVEKPLVSTERCNVAYPDDITDRMICAGLDEGGKDSCQGDSGGPLVMLDAAAKPVLTGVVSWGIGCARPGKYGVYSKVSAVGDWIAEKMGRTPASK